MKTDSNGKTLICMLLIILSCLLLYFNALENDFIYDDKDQVLGNKWIRDIRYIPEIFSEGVWSFSDEHVISNYYRPVMHVFYMVNYYLFGLEPWGFHIMNILLHSGVSLLVFLIASRLLARSDTTSYMSYLSPPFVAAMLFTAHPVHTEAVTWIAGLPDVAVTFFSLLSLYFYIVARDDLSLSRGRYVLSVALFFLAALSKETALVLPVIFVVYDRLFKKEPVKFQDFLRRYLPYLGVLIFYFILRSHALRGFLSKGAYQDLGIYQKIINIFPLFSGYLQKMVLPLDLHFWYTFHPLASLLTAKGLSSLCVTVAFAGLCYLAAKKNRGVFFSLVLMFIPLLPALYISAIPGKPFAERYLYFPSVGFVLLVAFILSWVENRKETKVLAGAIIAFTVVFGFYAEGTVSRNTVWKDDYTFWKDTAEKAQDSDLSRANFGVALLDKGMAEQAIEEFNVALALNVSEPFKIHQNLGIAHMMLNLPDRAIEDFLAALRLRPNYAEAHFGLGFAYMKKGLIDKALQQYQAGLRLKPYDATARYKAGLAFFSKGMADKAIEQYLIALKLEPNNANLHNSLGLAYGEMGLTDRAMEQFGIAVRLKPDFGDAHYNLALDCIKKGSVDEAIDHLKLAVRLDPDRSDYSGELAKAEMWKRRVSTPPY